MIRFRAESLEFPRCSIRQTLIRFQSNLRTDSEKSEIDSPHATANLNFMCQISMQCYNLLEMSRMIPTYIMILAFAFPCLLISFAPADNRVAAADIAVRDRNTLIECDSKPKDFSQLLKPRVRSSIEWSPQIDGIGVTSYDVTIQQPTYPFFGPPPPFIIIRNRPATELGLRRRGGLGWHVGV